jgi:tetratricopeptide (TPR) repeat protein
MPPLHEAQRRHAAYYIDVLKAAESHVDAGGDRTTLGLNLFDRERENIEVGQAWAVTHSGEDYEATKLCAWAHAPALLLMRQHPRKIIEWEEAALDSARRLNKGPDLENLKKTWAAAGFSVTSSLTAEPNSLMCLGLSYMALSETQRAIDLFEQALASSREFRDQESERVTLNNLGLAYMRLGKTHRAVELLEEALAIASGDRPKECNTLIGLGSAYARLGERPRAIGLYERALAIAREFGDRKDEHQALRGLGQAYADLGEMRRAIELYQQALAIARELGDPIGEAEALRHLGAALRKQGQLKRAVECFERCIAITHAFDDLECESEALEGLGITLASSVSWPVPLTSSSSAWRSSARLATASEKAKRCSTWPLLTYIWVRSSTPSGASNRAWRLGAKPETGPAKAWPFGTSAWHLSD